MNNSMKINRILIVLFLFGLFFGLPTAKAQVQIERTAEKVKVGGKEYYMHHVKSGQTLGAISQVYQVSVEEIERLNPEVKEGLKTGLVIGIPVRPLPAPKVEPIEGQTEGAPKEPIDNNIQIETPQKEHKINSEEKAGIDKQYAEIERSKEITKIGGKQYYLHYVKSGQTLYGISKAYNVTIEEIERLNPEVKEGLKVGYVIGIPVRDVQEQIAEPETIVEEPVAEAVIEPVKETVIQSVEEPVVEPVEEPVVESVEEPVVESVEEPLMEPEVNPVPEPVPEPVEEPEAELVEEPEEETVSEPVEESEAEQVMKPEEPVNEPEIEPIEAPVVAPVEELKVQPTRTPTKAPVVMKAGSHYTVQAGEDLYDIAKKFGIDVAEFKAINPGLTNYPAAGTTILLPDIQDVSDYIVHKVEYSERTTSLLKRWKVLESDFRVMNVSVGTHVFENQIVLIPIDPVQYVVESNDVTLEEEDEEEEEIVTPAIEEKPQKPFFDEIPVEVPECKISPENAYKRYKVALMVPLYLYDVGNIEVSKTKAAKSAKGRSMSFLQFYEGFMMAAESLRDTEGLKLDLTVIDVTDNVSSAHQAVSQIEGKDFDLIVGPFFGKSFAVVEEYAKAHQIPVVNPLSNRTSVIEDNPNVVKMKPGNVGQILTISNLIKNYYNNSNVFIISRENDADTAYLNQLEHHLNLAVNEEVAVSGDEFLRFARNESERQEMGSKIVPTVDVEGQVYSTDEFQNGSKDKVVLANPVKRYSYSEIGKAKSQLSGVRNNLIIAYGDDNVFATQVLNSLTKDADRFPITLICVPDWTRFEKLLVDNLLKMNAIYVNDFFVDYRSDAAKRFVFRFRNRYLCEPQKYAFEGYDIGMYFLTALMRYGDDLMDCLHCHDVPLLHTHYRFYYQNYLQAEQHDGKENLYWSVYQYDKDLIELKPLSPFKKASE
jgi:LysM repeat protein